MKPLEQARVAIVHEWLTGWWGSDRVVAAILDAFPEADLHALVYNPEVLRGTSLEGVPVCASFIQSLPGATRRWRAYLPLMPLAAEQFDMRPYDLVISSSHAVAKGVLTRADQLHVSYVHTPIRYAWDLYHDYLEESGLSRRGPKGWLARAALHYVRLWDSSADRVDVYLTNSRYVARRIKKLYRREARVLYPPVDVGPYRADLPRDDFYVAVSRFVPYKRMGLIVEAFTANVKLLGWRSTEETARYLQRARAFVFAAEEDFGITPLEAQAAGCPVIAYGKGGALETVVGWPEKDATGLFFDAQTPEALRAAVALFEAHEGDFDPQTCRRNADRFGLDRFVQELRDAVGEAWGKFQRGETPE